ncbi:MAG: hypothetical protein HYX92_08990 [Chloroflexi bacterium]|nr:hypothetical protein [Chloroflexota bacterium]
MGMWTFLYLVILYPVSLLVGYELVFTRATLLIGTSISYDGSKTGFQDAVTPPWSNYLAILAYVSALAWIILGFWQFGLLIGAVSIIGLIVFVVVNTAIILPKPDGDHLRNLILHSMMNRYANYVKEGDELRADAMGELLERLDIPVSEIRSRSTGRPWRQS